MIRDGEGLGIFFGPDGLHIPLAPGSERTAKCKLVSRGLERSGQGPGAEDGQHLATQGQLQLQLVREVLL